MTVGTAEPVIVVVTVMKDAMTEAQEIVVWKCTRLRKAAEYAEGRASEQAAGWRDK